MIIKMDQLTDYGASGSYLYSLSIPYHDGAANISYYINKQGASSIMVKATSAEASIYNIVPKGDLANWVYNDCQINY